VRDGNKQANARFRWEGDVSGVVHGIDNVRQRTYRYFSAPSAFEFHRVDKYFTTFLKSQLYTFSLSAFSEKLLKKFCLGMNRKLTLVSAGGE
jgi:hypothetical protein